jgi:hypothetical protein
MLLKPRRLRINSQELGEKLAPNATSKGGRRRKKRSK